MPQVQKPFNISLRGPFFAPSRLRPRPSLRACDILCCDVTRYNTIQSALFNLSFFNDSASKLICISELKMQFLKQSQKNQINARVNDEV